MDNRIIKTALICIFCCLAISMQPATAKITAKDLDQRVLQLAVAAYKNAQSAGIVNNHFLTVVDYSLPSTQPRMWVINMETKKVVYHTHVAHGVGSGNNYASKFSNTHGSHMSSLGIFLTADTYHGNHGLSLNLKGLQKQYNSNALSRRIVVHGADYVDRKVINKIGRLGRSFGCLAVNKEIAKEIMHTIKNGSVVFCYYPDKIWLRESTILSL